MRNIIESIKENRDIALSSGIELTELQEKFFREDIDKQIELLRRDTTDREKAKKDEFTFKPTEEIDWLRSN